MKKILIFLIGALMTASCSSDIFDVDPSGKVSQESKDEIAKKDPDKVLLGTESSIYVHYATYYGEFHWLTGLAGFYLTFGMAGQDMPLLQAHSQNNYVYFFDYWQEEYDPTAGVWKMFYTPIATANEILLTASKELSAESDGLAGYRARALTSRAFAFYHLINIYQHAYSDTNKNLPGIPLATEATMGQNLPRGTQEQVYQQIIDDLDEAMELFEKIGYDDMKSRTDFDWTVAAMIRARVALFMKDWTLAAKLAGDVQAKYTLLAKADFNNGFNQLDKVSSTIFGFKMTADNSMGFASWVSQMDPYLEGYAGLWAERPIHSYLYAKLNSTDVRRGWWLNKTDNPDPNAVTSGYPCLLPSNLSNILTTGVKSRSEYVSVKFRANKGDWNSSDLIYMRAEEAVFIKAEAEAHTSLATAKTTLENYVKTYRDPSYTVSATTEADVITEIIQQKRIEMWMEGALEYFDRRRLDLPIDRKDNAVMTAAGIANNHIDKQLKNQGTRGLRWLLPRAVVIANTAIGEANQNPAD